MRFATVAALAGVASAASNGTWASSYVTEVVTAYTTFCPEATELTHAGITYTVTEPSTVTITNCPCTIVKPVSSSVVTSCSSAPSSSLPSSGLPIASTGVSSGGIPSVYATGPATYSVPSPSATVPVVGPSQSATKNAGSSVQVAGLFVGAGALAALLM